MSLDNGKSVNGMPQITSAFGGWQQDVTLIQVTSSVVNALRVDTETTINFTGTIQPLGQKEIMLKPEGQRSWQWLQIHVTSSRLNLNVNDIVQYRNLNYKIMGIYDYSLNGFMEYHAVYDYQP